MNRIHAWVYLSLLIVTLAACDSSTQTPDKVSSTLATATTLSEITPLPRSLTRAVRAKVESGEWTQEQVYRGA